MVRAIGFHLELADEPGRATPGSALMQFQVVELKLSNQRALRQYEGMATLVPIILHWL